MSLGHLATSLSLTIKQGPRWRCVPSSAFPFSSPLILHFVAGSHETHNLILGCQAEVQQVREALAIRENQIRRLEQELSMAGDPCMRDHRV